MMNNPWFFFLFWTFFISNAGFVFAQRPPLPLEQLSVGKGRFNNLIMGLLQDRRGFLWVGTMAGLYRYDGTSFRHYPFPSVPREQHPDPFWHNAPGAGQLLEDHRGNIWVVNTYSESSYGWLKMLDIRQDTFVNFDLRVVSKPVVYGKPLIKDREGNIWAQSWEGLYRISPQGRKPSDYEIRLYSYEPDNAYSLSDSAVTSILLDSRDRLWIGTEGGTLHLYDRQKDRIRRLDTLGKTAIRHMAETGSGQIAVAGEKGLYFLEPEMNDAVYCFPYLIKAQRLR